MPMSIVDDRGRVAGRVNLIDAFAALFIIVLLPVAFGAYLLFRTPPAKLTGVFPDRLYQGRNLRVEITGKNLRPFMRVAFNTIQARTFMIGSTTYAQADLPELTPGVYDVQLFDNAQEIDRLPKALTVLPLAPVPTVEMEVDGKFTGLPTGVVGQITAGLKFPPTPPALAEVLRVGASVPAHLRLRAGEQMVELPLTGQTELTATLRVKCYIAQNGDGTLRCEMPGPQQSATIMPDSVLTLAGPQGWLSFQIVDVRPPSPSRP
jgi:hypothetical protein